MKKLNLLFTFSIIFFSACGFSGVNLNSNDGNLERIPSDKQIDTTTQTIIPGYEVDSACKDLLIEIKSERYGAVYPPGKLLDFRAIRNGQLEYDSDEHARISRKAKQLSSSQIGNLVTLSKEIKLSKSEYMIETPCLDARFEKKIVFCSSKETQRKEILIRECRPLNSAEGEKVPLEIRKILEYTNNLKN